MIVILDNRDSFVFNLARYFVLLGAQVKVLPSHETDLEEIQSAKPQALVISPGPCTPKEAGVSIACVQKFRGIIPILGVCLGHQVIVEALGGTVLASNDPRSDGGLDGHLELLTGNEFPQFLRHSHAVAVGLVLVHDGGEGVDRISVQQDVHFDEICGLLATGLVVQRCVSPRSRLELIEEVEDDLRQRQGVAHLDAILG